jgi:hypothetical protein
MLAAPLIAGNNISTMNNTIKDILTAPEIIAIDQDLLGKQGTRIKNNDGLQVWQKPLLDGSVAIALLNQTNIASEMTVTLEEIGFKNGIVSSVRDLWNRKDLAVITENYKTNVEPHGVVVLKIKGQKAPVSMLKFNEPEIELNKGNHTLIQLTSTPSNTSIILTSSNEDVLSLAISGVNKYRLTALNEGKSIITATTADGRINSTCSVQILPSNIPSPWKLDDIKDNKASATFDNGVFAIEGGGSDIWNATDQFALLSRQSDEDAYILARIISQTNTDPWAKTGIMFRESTDANSKFVLICITPGNGVSIQWRDSTGGSCDKKDFSTTSLPIYFKLTKKGSIFSAFKSADGNQWEPLGDIALSKGFDKKYLSGLLVLSHNSHMLNLSKFDHVTVGQIKSN